jgi:hypothetical protein
MAGSFQLFFLMRWSGNIRRARCGINGRAHSLRALIHQR